MATRDPSDLDLTPAPSPKAAQLSARILGLVALQRDQAFDRDDPDFMRGRGLVRGLTGLDLGSRPEFCFDGAGRVAQRDNDDRWVLLKGPWAEEVLGRVLAEVEARALRAERRRLRAIADAQELEQARLSMEARLAGG